MKRFFMRKKKLVQHNQSEDKKKGFFTQGELLTKKIKMPLFSLISLFSDKLIFKWLLQKLYSFFSASLSSIIFKL